MNGLISLDVEFSGVKVRVVGTAESPEWVASDACRILGIDEPQSVLRRFKPSERGRCLIDTPSGKQEMLTVTEPGLYRLIFKSRKPEAEKFRVFVTHDLLPTIRKHGCWPEPEMTVTSTSIVRIDEEALGRAIGHHMGLIRSDLDEFRTETTDRFDSIESRLDGIERRKNLTRKTKREHVQTVFRMFGGLCPCCKKKRIVNSHGEALVIAQYDHWKQPSIPDVEWTWVICDECNLSLRSAEFKREHSRDFDHYQETRIRLRRIIQPRLPGMEDSE